jgi:hypothetical protein
LSVLGILVMNSVSFGLVPAAYFNLSAGGSVSWLDKAIGAAGEVFVDQKTMGLFSMLFGAGIVLFADRAAVTTEHPVRLVLWRNALLLLIGFLHGLIWEGDVLIVYAVCAPLLVWMCNVRPRVLLIAGVGLVAWSAVVAGIVQTQVLSDGDRNDPDGPRRPRADHALESAHDDEGPRQSPGNRPDGTDQLPHADHARHLRAPIGHRASQPRPFGHRGVRRHRVGHATGMVEAVARPLPIRSRRAALAHRDVPPLGAVPPIAQRWAAGGQVSVNIVVNAAMASSMIA